MGFVKKIAPYAIGGIVGGTAYKKGGPMALLSPAAALLGGKKDKPATDPNRPIESGSLVGEYDRNRRKSGMLN